VTELAKNQTVMLLDALNETRKPWNKAVVINAERHRSHDDTILQAKIADASRLFKQHG
jgi:hypothetical protein